MAPRRKSYKQISALNLAIFSTFIMVWLFGYMKPIFSSLFEEDDLFYGTVSFIAIPSVFGNSNIPFLDKQMFKINNDKNANFHLYLSRQQKIEMQEWFRWWDAEEQMPIALEIKAARINKSTWIVKELNTFDGSISKEVLDDYHLRIAFWGLFIETILLFTSIHFIRFFLKQKPSIEPPIPNNS